MNRPDHAPMGDPCSVCGKSALAHRVEHNYVGTGARCGRCGLTAERHRVRQRPLRVDDRCRIGRKQEGREREQIFLGIDGEGQGRTTHRYVLLAASDEAGLRHWHVRNMQGLSTEQCLEFIFSLPSYARLFSFSFGYDLTKILQDCTNEVLYKLFRPEMRQRVGKEAFKGPKPVRWKDWLLNLQGTKFTVGRIDASRNRIVWDIWKFYQSKFVSALEDWKVGTAADLEHMRRMKDKRAEFDKESEADVLHYCYKECRFMAELARRLVEAHTAAGLKLKNFYGAGSSASAMLQKMGVQSKIMLPPLEMKEAVAAGFFGGRFENGVVGAVRGRVFSYDISSAYPYQLCFLPCLIHGTWELTKNRKDIDSASAALVHYALSGTTKDMNRGWGPFPFRTSDGSICFPYTSGGGWVWRDEYVQGERLFPAVEFVEAWVYHTDCDCRPFADIPHYYRERCRIGKEGPGIVLKLGSNSCYGKLAQSVGRGPFNSWVWAGIITSGCRAQCLEALGLHKDWSNLLMIATDGIQTLEELKMPVPKDTGTWDAIVTEKDGSKVAKPLGGWEKKIVERGVFYARPGVYFPLEPGESEAKSVRGRGVGRTVIMENWPLIVKTWEEWDGRGDYPEARVANVSRFCGAKSSISRAVTDEGYVYNRANGHHLDDVKPMPAYGEWVTRRVSMSFNPWPKREGVLRDGRTLTLRAIDPTLESAPYRKALMSREAQELAQHRLELSEQPDADLSDYSVDDTDT